VLSAECPNCGAAVAFKHAASAATVCDACQSTVLREGTDELVLWGKVSAFSRDLSPIQVGASGVLGKRSFEVAGVLRRSRPGVRWNEWYVVFDDRSTGWLSEGNGVLQIFGGQQPTKPLPSFDRLEPGGQLRLGDDKWVVIERSEAAIVAAEGELPFAVRGGEMRPYADLRTADGRQTGTIDYADETPVFWPGRIVTLESLQMEGLRAFAGWSDPTLVAMQGPEIQAQRGLDCPNCGGSIQLRSPGTTVQLICEYCGSKLSIDEVGDQNTSKVLRAHQGQFWKPRLALGTRGRIEGVEWEIIGAMKRAVRYEGVDYPWVEYFLYNPYRGSPSRFARIMSWVAAVVKVCMVGRSPAAVAVGVAAAAEVPAADEVAVFSTVVAVLTAIRLSYSSSAEGVMNERGSNSGGASLSCRTMPG